MSLEVKNIYNKYGLFTNNFIKKNEVISRIDGKIIQTNDFASIPVDYLQFDSNRFLDLNGTNEFYLRHSCNPNCFIKSGIDKVFLLSIRNILPQEELFIDYSISSTEDIDTFSMECYCGYPECRKIISGYKKLPKEKQAEYYNFGIIPSYI